MERSGTYFNKSYLNVGSYFRLNLNNIKRFWKHLNTLNLCYKRYKMNINVSLITQRKTKLKNLLFFENMNSNFKAELKLSQAKI